MLRESNTSSLKINKQLKLLDRVRAELRRNHYSKWKDHHDNEFLKVLELKKNMIIDNKSKTALNTHRLHRVVSHNTILPVTTDRSANEPLDFTSISFLFFCSFTDLSAAEDKILNS
jgi:hypothetical protein